jgi:hypothetical protein
MRALKCPMELTPWPVNRRSNQFAGEIELFVLSDPHVQEPESLTYPNYPDRRLQIQQCSMPNLNQKVGLTVQVRVILIMACADRVD